MKKVSENSKCLRFQDKQKHGIIKLRINNTRG